MTNGDVVNSILTFLLENVKASHQKLVYNIILQYRDLFLDRDFYIRLDEPIPQEHRYFLAYSPFMFDFKENLEMRHILYDLASSLVNKEACKKVCGGNGYIGEGGIFLVGMAPGFYYGHEIDKISEPFKPSWFFAQTSKILRMGVLHKIEYCYFTNLAKMVFAKSEMNEAKYEELYSKYFYVLEKEIELLKPQKIISLGRNVYNFLSKCKIDTEFMYHPSYFWYRKQFATGRNYYRENI